MQTNVFSQKTEVKMKQIFMGKFVTFFIVLTSVCMITMTVLTVAFVARLDELVRVSTVQVNTLGRFINEDPRGIKGTFSNANAILVQTGLAMDELRRASKKQSAYWDKTGEDITGTIKLANELITTTSGAASTLDKMIARVGDGPIAESTAALRDVRSLIKSTENSVNATVTETNLAIAESRKLLINANAIMAASKLESSFDYLNQTTAGLSRTSSNVADTTGYIRDMFKPTKKSFWRMAVESWLPLGIKSIIPQSSLIRGTPTVVVEEKK